MYCVKCGKELNDNAKFCTKCGKKLVTPNKLENHVSQPVYENNMQNNMSMNQQPYGGYPPIPYVQYPMDNQKRSSVSPAIIILIIIMGLIILGFGIIYYQEASKGPINKSIDAIESWF